MGRNLVIILPALAYFTAIIDLLILSYKLPKNIWMTQTSFVVLTCIALIYFIVKQFERNQARYRFIEKIFFIMVMGTLLPFLAIKEAFGVNDVQSIIVTLTQNDLGKLSAIGVADFTNLIGRYVALGLAILVSWWLIHKHSQLFKFVATASAVIFIPVHPLTSQVVEFIVPNKAHQMISIENDFVEPRIISKPAKKKNLILVYLESVERTYKEIPVTKNEFSQLAQYEDNNLSFRNTGQIRGTHFTLGGLVATQCGIPYYSKGLLDLKKKMKANTHVNVGIEEVFPSITCLGDLLTDEGYTASYINGSDLNVFSKGLFFQNHGYQSVFGINVLDNPEAEPLQNVWGLNDEYVFEKVKGEIKSLSQTGDPFLLSMLTISTHGPDAFLDVSCEAAGTETSLIPRAIECTANHVEALVRYVEELGIADDTLIVLMSDHLAMKNTVYSTLKERENRRRNYFVVLNGEANKVVKKLATTMDTYPTLLNLLGYELEQDRANFGSSLLRDTETLASRLGLETLNKAFLKNSEIQKFVWR